MNGVSTTLLHKTFVIRLYSYVLCFFTGVLLYFLTPRKRGEVEVISCDSETTANELCSKLKRAVNVATSVT